ncbi:unnamed protein product, partial [Mesorhabditis belari]|uniref:Uncharacterized protein n=1 Tax=Mesorhabditis belari TaxID=2138241 RepID=A0AAF3FCI8_9BILA
MLKLTDLSRNGKTAMFGTFTFYFLVVFSSDMIASSETTPQINKTISLPNITFCVSADMINSYVKVNKSETIKEWDRFVEAQLAEMNTKSLALNPTRRWDDRLLFESYDYLAVLNSLERETDSKQIGHPIWRYKNLPELAGKRAMYQKWQNWMDKLGISYEELRDQVGNQLFLRSILTFSRSVSDERIMPRLKIQWISIKQMCFSPIYSRETFRDIEKPGKFFTLFWQTDVENLVAKGVKSFDCMQVDFHGRVSSLNRFLKGDEFFDEIFDGQARATDGFFDGGCIGEYHKLVVEIETRVHLPKSIGGETICVERKAGDETEFDCFSRCRYELIRNNWKCLPRTMAHLVTEDDRKNFQPCDYAKVDITEEEANAGYEEGEIDLCKMQTGLHSNSLSSRPHTDGRSTETKHNRYGDRLGFFHLLGHQLLNPMRTI